MIVTYWDMGTVRFTWGAGSLLEHIVDCWGHGRSEVYIGFMEQQCPQYALILLSDAPL